MAAKFQSTADVRCRKTHLCVGCGGQFSYVLARTVSAQAATEEAAAEKAHAAASAAASRSVDRHPCPHCGVLQPEMVAEDVQPWFVGGLCTALVGVFIPLVAGLAHGLSLYVASQAAAVGLAMAWLVHLRGAAVHPNRSPESNLTTALAAVDAGKLQVGPPAADDRRPDVEKQVHRPLLRAPEAGRQLGIGLALAAAPVALAPVILATFSGWFVNSTCYPSVAGPGDVTRFYFKSKINSLKGMWNGSASAVVVNNDELNTVRNVGLCTTKDSKWGGMISGKGLSNNTNQMYCDVKIPDDPAVAGKMMELALDVKARFPYLMARGEFEIREQSFSDVTSLVLAGPKAGEAYFRAFWVGQLVAAALSVMAFLAFLGGCNDLRAARSETLLGPADGGAEE